MYNILWSPHLVHRGTPRGYIEHVIRQAKRKQQGIPAKLLPEACRTHAADASSTMVSWISTYRVNTQLTALVTYSKI